LFPLWSLRLGKDFGQKPSLSSTYQLGDPEQSVIRNEKNEVLCALRFQTIYQIP
jgi:hypothetical protein